VSIFTSILMAAISGPSVKTIANSITWSNSTGEALSKQFSSASDDNRIYTYSIWYKVGGLNQFIIMGTTSNVGSGNSAAIVSLYQNKLTTDCYDYNAGGTKMNLTTTANTTLYGVNGAWHHVHIAVDSTQSTASNRVKVYLDGTRLTSFDTETYPPQNQNMFPMTSISNSSHFTGSRNLTSYVGNGYVSAVNYNTYAFNGNLADVNVVDGLALPVDTFAADIGGTWTPMEYTGSYGSNGFNLNMANSAFGTDSSGNGNNFTSTNIASGDVSNSVPPA